MGSTIFQSVIQGGYATQSQMVLKKHLNTDLDFESKKELRA
jgi:hypothetical protein